MADAEGQYVGFMLGGEHYGIDIMMVEEIIRLMDITPVPRAPAFIEGIINLRGRIIPVVDLRTRLRIKPKGDPNNERIVVMRVNTRRLGLLVDQVEEVMRIPHEKIDQAPGSTSISNNYVEGVARLEKGMTIILDVFRIFSAEEQKQLMDLHK